jgi:hypothetical protein
MLSAGCMMGQGKKVATPADLQQLGTRSYPTHSREEVVAATVTALKLLGYEVVTTDPRIRTAPKLQGVTSSATYTETSGQSTAYAESVAWDIDVTPEGQGAKVHAEPRASVNGQAMEQVWYDWAAKHYGELFKEIDGSFGAKP